MTCTAPCTAPAPHAQKPAPHPRQGGVSCPPITPCSADSTAPQCLGHLRCSAVRLWQYKEMKHENRARRHRAGGRIKKTGRPDVKTAAARATQPNLTIFL
jgi:hypothetical protein